MNWLQSIGRDHVGQVRALGLSLLAALIFTNAAAGQTITDGDTLKQGGMIYRLWGIDAPEAKQICPDGTPPPTPTGRTGLGTVVGYWLKGK
jgi:endonuclease YncB( thermonuclease family)